LSNLGEQAFKVLQEARELLVFLGKNILAFINLLRGRAQFRCSDSLLVMEQCGPQALGIVALLNCLVGLILPFVGAIELQRFGASIYVSDLVGIATIGEMGLKNRSCCLLDWTKAFETSSKVCWCSPSWTQSA
jgi:phospholipid/cholesterol/gamma-HCH transport system permease protein